jgi:transposase-like protein
MVIEIITCPHCGSPDIIKNGVAPNGKQKYLCHTCARQSCENPDPQLP